ncbi:MAG TPA: MFS transporter [Dehalococcoidia bacterium]|nr:MFS transporter [Dehalococcoidia bacterium]
MRDRSEPQDRWLGIRLLFISFLFYFAMMVSYIFIPLFARDLGASNLELGLVGAAYGISYFACSLIFGRQADIHGRVKFIGLGLALGSAAFFGQCLANGPVSLMLIRAGVGGCLGICLAALMAYVYEMAGRVGRFVSFGSLGLLCGCIVTAFVHSYHDLFLVSALAFGVAFVLALTLREHRPWRQALPPVTGAVFVRNWGVYIPFLLRHLSAHSIWIIFPLFIKGLGGSKTWISILFAINFGGQFLAMQFMERFNAFGLFRVGLLLSALVCLAYTLAGSHIYLIPIQALLAVAWSCAYVGALVLLLRRNAERATAAGILFSAQSLAMGIGPFLGGAVSQLWGFHPVMYLACGLTTVGLALSQMARFVGRGGA